MSEILLDVTRLLRRFIQRRLPTGIDRVSLAYVQHFGDSARAVVTIGRYSVVFSRSGSLKLFESLLNNTADLTLLFSQLLHRDGFALLWGRKYGGVFLCNTGHQGLECTSHLVFLQTLGVKSLVLVHDLIPLSHPEYCRPGEMEKHQSRINNVLRFASGVITNSQATLEALLLYADKTGQSTPPFIVAPLAAAKLPAPSIISPLPAPYFLVLGTIEPRKNHWLLLHIWRRLIERSGVSAPKLVIIGQRGWECENVFDLLERGEAIRDFVIELHSCSDTDLSTYLFHAQSLLFPSFAEGYGLPLMEALTFGIPVIASDLPVFREIAGDIPEYLDPLDSMGWLATIEAYSLPNHPQRTAQENRRRDFNPPTWAGHFQLVKGLMERLE